METFWVDLKTLLGLILPNQCCHVVMRKIVAGFWVILYHWPRLHLQCPYYIVLLYCMISNQKQPSCKKRGQPPKKPGWKKMWIQRWQPRKDGGLMAKILITTIQVNLCSLLQVSLGFSTKFTWIVVIKSFAINLPSQPFLGRHLWFHIFFSPWLFWRPHPFQGCAHNGRQWSGPTTTQIK